MQIKARFLWLKQLPHTEQIKVFIFLFSLFTCVALLIIFLIELVWKNKIYQEKQLLTTEYELRQKQVVEVEYYRKQILIFNKLYHKYGGFLWQPFLESEVLVRCNNMAERCGVILKSIQPLPAEKQHGLHVYPWQLTVSGSYAQIEAFALGLTKINDVVISDEFILKRQTEEQGIGQGNISLLWQMKILFYREGK
jgi:Tfp pilus assembly protein PilO